MIAIAPHLISDANSQIARGLRSDVRLACPPIDLGAASSPEAHTMVRIVPGCCLLPLVFAAACGGSSPSAPAAQISVGGSYDIRKTVVSDTCGQFTPGTTFTNPGDVRHTAGSTTLVLNDHGTRDLPGTLNRDGTFALAPSRGLVMNTINAVDTFDGGRFSTTGFDLRVTTDLDSTPGGGPACRVVTTWAGSKIGAPNVIP
jgi:hypothetical protein